MAKINIGIAQWGQTPIEKEQKRLMERKRKHGDRLRDYWGERNYYDPEAMEAREREIGSAVDFDKFNWAGGKDKLYSDMNTNFADSSMVKPGGAYAGAWDRANTSVMDRVGGMTADYVSAMDGGGGAGSNPWAQADKGFLDKQRQYAAEDRDQALSGAASDLAGSGLLSGSALQRTASQAMENYDRVNTDTARNLYQGNQQMWGQLGQADVGNAMSMLNMGQNDYYQGVQNRMNQFTGDRNAWAASQEAAKQRQLNQHQYNQGMAATPWG